MPLYHQPMDLRFHYSAIERFVIEAPCPYQGIPNGHDRTRQAMRLTVRMAAVDRMVWGQPGQLRDDQMDIRYPTKTGTQGRHMRRFWSRGKYVVSFIVT